MKKQTLKISALCIMLVMITSVLPLAGALNVINEIGKNSLLSFSDPPQDYLDQENIVKTNTGSCVIVPDYFWLAQSFKPTLNILTRIQIKLGAAFSGASQYGVELVIRSTLDGNNIISVSTQTSDNANIWIEFDFTDLSVIPEKTYYILWRTTEGSLSWENTCNDFNGDPYERGDPWLWVHELWQKSLWNTKDFLFKTYGRNGNDGNHPPGEVELISSTTEGKINQDLNFQFRCSDVDNDKIKYNIELRKKPELGIREKPEEIITELYTQSETNSVNLKISTPSVYWMAITALDEHNAGSPNTIDLGPIYVSDIENSAPNKPVLSGEDWGQTLKEYEYTATSWDCDKEDQIWYLFDWGDGTTSSWLGPYNNGETCKAKHRWIGINMYDVKVKAKDAYGKESEWSDIMEVFMPKSKQLAKPAILKLLGLYPNAFPILQRLLKL